MAKPVPAFTLDDLDALLVETQRIEEEEDRDWFAVRDLVGTWCDSDSGVRKRLRLLILAGHVEPAGGKLMPGILDPSQRYRVATYRIVREEG